MKSKDDILKLLHLLDQNTAELLEDETLEFKQWISAPNTSCPYLDTIKS